MATWDNAFVGVPADTRLASLGASDIRTLKEAVHERIIHEHVMNLDVGTNTTDGWHRSGSAKVYVGTSAPTTRPDGTTALSADDNGRLWWDTEDNLVRRYAHPAWTTDANSIPLKAAVDALDAQNVKLTGDQTIAGTKTFSSAVSIGAGTTTSHAVRGNRSISAGNGLTGGGNLSANRTLSLNFITGTNANITSYPVGTYLIAQTTGSYATSDFMRNNHVLVRYVGANNIYFAADTSSSGRLAGTWGVRGYFNTSGFDYVLVQRVS